MIITRRSFLVGLISAPIIVHTGIIMPVKAEIIRPEDRRFDFTLIGPDGAGLGQATEKELRFLLKSRRDHRLLVAGEGLYIAGLMGKEVSLDWLGRVRGLPE